MKKKQKGEYGYPAYQTRFVIARTVCYFALAIAIFILGYVSTGTRENLLTVVSVLGLLPASKSLVSVIMYLRMPKFGKAVYDRLSAAAEGMSALYSMYLTSYKKNFPVSCFCVAGGNIIGYTEFKECDTAACEEHIRGLLKQNGFKNITVKIFGANEQRNFEDRLSQLRRFDEQGRESEILELLCNISL